MPPNQYSNDLLMLESHTLHILEKELWRESAGGDKKWKQIWRWILTQQDR